MTIGQYNPRSRGGVAYADLTRELLARAAAEAPGEGGAISMVPSFPAVATLDPRPEADPETEDLAPASPDELEPQLSADAPEGTIDG
jgi:hypothetical protein